jgi:hypothetical protein
MDSYKTAILRILIKRQKNPIEITSLVDGFPSHFKNEVTSSIFYLHSLGYVSIYHSPTGNKYISLNLEMKRDTLRLVNPDLDASYQNMRLDLNYNSNNTIDGIEKAVTEKKCTSILPSVRRSIIGAFLLIAAVSTWALLTAYNHPGGADFLSNKISDMQGPSVSRPVDYSLPQKGSDLVLVSNYIIEPPYNFAIIQTEFPISASTSMHHHNSYLRLIVEQIDSRIDVNSIIKITENSHRYRV